MDDLIRRKDVIDELNLADIYSTGSLFDGEIMILKEDAFTRISNLPSVKPEEKHGHWIIQSFDATCSECNTSICFDVDLSELDDVIETMDLYYCPHCGSKMEKAVVDI